MRHASLFSGIGAPELAAHWLGWENAFHCEINPFCKQVLKYWFNNSTSYDDITKTDFRKWQGKIDVLTGGFPCQPFSVAGKRKGAEDNRYLWPEFKRAIREVRPPWVVGENVAGILSMVQPGKKTNMEGLPSSECTVEQEFVVETICKDLEAEGYDVQPMVIPACAVGAPHRRDRVWFIAYNNSFRLQKKRTEQQASRDSGIYPYEFITNTDNSSTLRTSGEVERENTQKRIPERDNVQQPIQPTGLWSSSSYSSSCGQFHGAVIGQNDQFIQTKNGTFRKVNQNGTNGSVGLGRIFHLMNTPTASDWKGGSTRKQTAFQRASLRGEIHADYGTGRTSQLNPLFVEEMMGFPTYWILLPFIKEAAIPIEEILM